MGSKIKINKDEKYMCNKKKKNTVTNASTIF